MDILATGLIEKKEGYKVSNNYYAHINGMPLIVYWID